MAMDINVVDNRPKRMGNLLEKGIFFLFERGGFESSFESLSATEAGGAVDLV